MHFGQTGKIFAMRSLSANSVGRDAVDKIRLECLQRNIIFIH